MRVKIYHSQRKPLCTLIYLGSFVQWNAPRHGAFPSPPTLLIANSCDRRVLHALTCSFRSSIPEHVHQLSIGGQELNMRAYAIQLGAYPLQA